MYSEKFINEMKKELLRMREDIFSLLQSEKEDLDKLNSESAFDIIDQASNNFDKEILEKLGSSELKKLEMINKALLRIENGTYGLCLESKQPIPEDRLRAVPYTPYTVEVQAKLDKMKNGR